MRTNDWCAKRIFSTHARLSSAPLAMTNSARPSAKETLDEEKKRVQVYAYARLCVYVCVGWCIEMAKLAKRIPLVFSLLVLFLEELCTSRILPGACTYACWVTHTLPPCFPLFCFFFFLSFSLALSPSLFDDEQTFHGYYIYTCLHVRRPIHISSPRDWPFFFLSLSLPIPLVFESARNAQI